MSNVDVFSAGNESNASRIGNLAPTRSGRGEVSSSLISILWRRKGLVIFLALVGLGGGYFYYSQQPETFSAFSIVSVYRGQVRANTGSEVENVTESAPGVALIEAEVMSDAVLDAAISTADLTKFDSMPEDTDVVREIIRSGLRFRSELPALEAKERAVVEVSYESTDPLLATAVVNSVVSAYESHLGSRHRKAVDSIVGFFQEARDTILPQLNKLEEEYTAFRGSTPLEWTPDGEVLNPFRQESLKVEETLGGVQVELRQLNSKLKLIEEVVKDNTTALAALKDLEFVLEEIQPTESVASVVDKNVPIESEVMIQEKLVPKLVESDMLKSAFGANHPARKQLELEIAATRAALSELSALESKNREAVLGSTELGKIQEEEAKGLLRRFVSGLQRKRQLLQDHVAELEIRLADARDRAHNLVKFENENASFVRRIGRYQAMLDSFDSQLEKASLPLLTPGLEVDVLRPAERAGLVGPLLWKSLFAGTLLGAMVGGAFAWVIDLSEKTFRNPEEVADFLGLPILAHIPLMLVRKRKPSGNGEADVQDLLSPVLTVVHDPHSITAEAIRGIRTGLLCNKTKEFDYQVVQVTSSMSGDGKSTVVANLAVSIARAGKRVLIIDADLRRPTQDQLFGVSSNLGVTSVLNGECNVDEAIIDLPIEGLFLMSTGPRPANPAEALMLPDFGQMLDDVRSNFDVVILDSPPLLACTDASNIATNVDGVIFVMRVGRNSKPFARRATQMLQSMHVNIIGVVVNALGDSGYSSSYAASWSSQYGGLGTEYGYSYYRSTGDRYLQASKSENVIVRGRTRQSSAGNESVLTKHSEEA